MLQMRVLRLVIHARTREPVLLLGEIDGDRCLPVFLRTPQAQVISLGRRGSDDPLLTQDVLVPVVGVLGRSLLGVELVELREHAYRAELVFDGGTRLQVRASDGLAVVVREGLPISVAEQILDEVGQPIAELFPHGTDAPPEQQLAEFRAFIDEVSPEDFQDRGGFGDAGA
ncbi:MAG: bifunctional nuclease domain-containing protein [Sciscionella sp.]